TWFTPTSTNGTPGSRRPSPYKTLVPWASQIGTLKWTFPGNQQITNLWNGSYVQSGPAVTIRNVGYNGSIPAGGSYSGLGFTANFSGTNAAPASFSVNGVACR